MNLAAAMRHNETRRLIWTAGIIFGATMPHWPTLPIWASALLCCCISWRLATEFTGWRLPNRVARIVLAICALWVVLEHYHTINGVEAGSTLLIVMVALKFLETKTNRDQIVLLIIAYFILFAGLLAQRSPLILLYLTVFVWFTTVGLMQLGRQGALLGIRDTARLAGKLLLQALPVMIVLFLLFPRLPGPLWAMPGANSFGRTGLSDEMSPGDITELGLSDEVAFRVEFFSAPPRLDQLYWRGPVLSNFNGRTWSQGATEFRNGIEETLEFSGEPIDYRVMIEPTGRRWVFALDMVADWPDGENIVMEKHYQLQRFPSRIRTRQDYTLRSYPEYKAREELSEAQRNAYLYLPDNNNLRSRNLAAEWRASASTQRDIISNALQIFREETFFYTLTPPPLGTHAADDFLFETREGFCEHYASAFAVLMRAAGIPARVVTGYQGGELNPLGQYYLIYQSNAHAWTEVWLEDEGWVRVDPTAAVAPDRISAGLYGSALAGQRSAGGAFSNIPWLRELALAWDTANTYWNDRVLGYGPELQSALMESIGIAQPHWAKLVAIGVGLLATFLTALALYLGWAYRAERKNDTASRYFRKFCRKLALANVAPRRPCEGPGDFGRRAAASMPNASAEIGEITDSYLRTRYEMDGDGTELDRLKTLVRGFKPGFSS